VLVSEVMLQQTQVGRVLEAWPAFMDRFPTPSETASARVGDVVRAWGTLGYPRRARRLWETANVVATSGWPEDPRVLPGVGRYTAAALAAQVDDADVAAVDANIRRVVQRVGGRVMGDARAEAESVRIGAPLRGRDRLLALMDLGAIVCVARSPGCSGCPLRPGCATRGALPGEARRRAPAYEGSFRQRRGRVLAALRAGARPAGDVDAEALESLVADGLAVLHDRPDGPTAALP